MKNIIRRILISIFRIVPLSKKKILFIGYYGAQYGCNPKYLSEYFDSKNDGWDIVWTFTNPEKYDITYARKVKYFSLKYFYELCTSKVIVTNYRMTKLFRKREGQIYLQTWHSSLRLKMIEKDSESSLPSHYVTMAKRDSKQIDILLSGCKYSTEIFNRAFWYNGKILESGTPRCDLFFQSNDHKYNIIKQNLGISSDCKILLYAPTFRKNNSLSCYDVDYQRLKKTLSDKLGGKWKILVRLHPHLISFSSQLFQNEKGVIDVTHYDDPQELLLIADLLISDYSGLIFDYTITKRPCLLYTPDLDKYIAQDRHLYFDIEKLPFPICRTNDELNDAILNFDTDKYLSSLDSFLSQIGNAEDGNASKRVYEYITSTYNI